ncbi:hypothetical protein CRUP_015611 [Coryphaenoides rupestris]|nr:hypothetical protein CRUP_015611 [Coryphaenoides rupestris]
MSSFARKVKNSVAAKHKTSVAQRIQLRSYQLDGVGWLTQCLQNQQGCILGDEMGLGKTCQTISLLVYMRGFAPSLTVLCYKGDKEKRAELKTDAENKPFNVLLTTYERHYLFVFRWKWKVLVVDEAHRLKNQESLLYKILSEFSVGFRVLLTGTPIQNNLQEVYSLISFIQPDLFPPDQAKDFAQSYADLQKRPALAAELQSVLEPFLLRRVKAEVASDLPRKSELLLYHGLSTLQKKYYKAILTKDLDAFASEQGSKTRLMNILMQLRKCVDHPYLFEGVEPEPFAMGEHLVEASGKLCLLDSLLAFLHKGSVAVEIVYSRATAKLELTNAVVEDGRFSLLQRTQAATAGLQQGSKTRLMNILMQLRKCVDHPYLFEGVEPEPFAMGEHLVEASGKLCLLDSLLAFLHKGGHRVLLFSQMTREIVYSRATAKLELTNAVVEDGRFSLLQRTQAATAGLQDVDLGKILGRTQDGQWVTQEDPASPSRGEEEEEEGEEEGTDSGADGPKEQKKPNHMYYFEGRDYSMEPSAADQKSFQRLRQEEEQLAGPPGDDDDDTGGGPSLRHKAGVCLSGLSEVSTRKRKPLSAAELELRRQKSRESAAKRAKLQDDRKRKLEEQKQRKKLAWWQSSGYRSRCLHSEDSDEEEEQEEEEEERDDVSQASSTETDPTAIRYVLGDVTHPEAGREDAIIVHCVDDSGRWGRGGLFTALEMRSDEPSKQYEQAGRMKDLDLGNLALIVAQQRDRSNNLSGIHLSALETGLKKIYSAARRKKASVHLPRIGHASRGFNWYGTERLIRKYLSSRGVPTFIYYHKRSTKTTTSTAPPPAPPQPSTSTSPPPASPCGPAPASPGGSAEPAAQGSDAEAPGGETRSPAVLPDFLRGVVVFFYNLPATEKKRLARHLITYPHSHAHAG